jgi:isocitrate dehydrogenase
VEWQRVCSSGAAAQNIIITIKLGAMPGVAAAANTIRRNPNFFHFSSISRNYGNGISGGAFVKNRVTFSSPASHFTRALSLRCFSSSSSSSSGFDRVQVQNPIVEMDGNQNNKRLP